MYVCKHSLAHLCKDTVRQRHSVVAAALGGVSGAPVLVVLPEEDVLESDRVGSEIFQNDSKRSRTSCWVHEERLDAVDPPEVLKVWRGYKLEPFQHPHPSQFHRFEEGDVVANEDFGLEIAFPPRSKVYRAEPPPRIRRNYHAPRCASPQREHRRLEHLVEIVPTLVVDGCANDAREHGRSLVRLVLESAAGPAAPQGVRNSVNFVVEILVQ